MCRWMTCNDTVLAFTKEYVEPLLADLLPPGIGKLCAGYVVASPLQLFPLSCRQDRGGGSGFWRADPNHFQLAFH